MTGNCHVRFLEGWAAARPLGYSVIHSDGVSWVCSSVTCIDLGWLAMWHRHRPGAEPAYGPCLPRFVVLLGSELAKQSSQAHVGNPDLPGPDLLEPTSGNVLCRKPSGPACRWAVTFVRVKLAQMRQTYMF